MSKMKHNIGDLGDYLFDQLDVLTNSDLEGEELDKEIRRAEAIGALSDKLIRVGDLAYKTMVHMHDMGIDNPNVIPEMLEVKETNA